MLTSFCCQSEIFSTCPECPFPSLSKVVQSELEASLNHQLLIYLASTRERVVRDLALVRGLVGSPLGEFWRLSSASVGVSCVDQGHYSGYHGKNIECREGKVIGE